MSATNQAGAAPKAPVENALKQLKADHLQLSGLFAAYEKTRSAAKKKALVADICMELSVHAQLEEESFYPEVKAAFKDQRLVSGARGEHASLKSLIAQPETALPQGDLYDAKVKVLAEYVQHHVKEERGQMFPKVTASALDLREIGKRMAARKEKLLAMRS